MVNFLTHIQTLDPVLGLLGSSGHLGKTLLAIFQVVLCIFMVFVILLQPGTEEGMGAAFGGGNTTSAFGGSGAVSFLGKITWACGILFFITSLVLSFMGMKSSVVSAADTKAPVAQHAPVTAGKAASAPSAAAAAKSTTAKSPVTVAPAPAPAKSAAAPAPAHK